MGTESFKDHQQSATWFPAWRSLQAVSDCRHALIVVGRPTPAAFERGRKRYGRHVAIGIQWGTDGATEKACCHENVARLFQRLIMSDLISKKSLRSVQKTKGYLEEGSFPAVQTRHFSADPKVLDT